MRRIRKLLNRKPTPFNHPNQIDWWERKFFSCVRVDAKKFSDLRTKKRVKLTNPQKLDELRGPIHFGDVVVARIESSTKRGELIVARVVGKGGVFYLKH